jgi:protein-disulfide isomerase
MQFLRPLVVTAGFPTLLLAAFACNVACTPKPQAGAGSADPSTVVATINGKKITLAEVDQHISAQLSEMEEQKFNLRKQGLDDMVNDQLVKAAAAKAGISDTEYLKKEIEGKIPEPSEDQVKQVFTGAAGRLPPDAKLADFRDRIVMFLKQQGHEKRSQELYAQLQKDAKVEITLKAPAKPRVQVEAVGPTRGPKDAKITIVEFSDFECPFCSRAKATVDDVLKAYPTQVKLYFRQFPLSFHPNAQKAAEAALCAHDQNKFWEMHDTMFGGQSELAVENLKEKAKKTGLNAEEFDKCLDSGKHAQAVAKDIEAGKKAGVSGTPAFFINGVFLSGAQPIEEFKKVIDQELAAK